MKTLFLDIDGVLNRQGTNRKHLVEMDTGTYTGLEPSLVELFLDWWKLHPDLNLVLSSTWRYDIKACQHLADKGLSWVAVTPKLFGMGRGWEIKRSVEELKPDAFAILDDIGDMRPLQRYLVQTSERWGLQEKHLKRVNTLLGYGE